MAQKNQKNPMRTKNAIWVWLLLFPIAVVIDVIFEVNNSGEKRSKKRTKRKADFYKSPLDDEEELNWDLDEYN